MPNINQKKKFDALFLQEVSLMNQLSAYPYFAQLIGFNAEALTILMKKYNQGDLSLFLARKTILLTKDDILKLMLDISKGIRIMHNFEYAHCDIKSENILVEQNPRTGEVHAVLTDFGITRILKNADMKVKSFDVQIVNGWSLLFAAPECLQIRRDKSTKKIRDDPRDGAQLKASDIYSLGCIFYELLNRTPVWKAKRSAVI